MRKKQPRLVRFTQYVWTSLKHIKIDQQKVDWNWPINAWILKLDSVLSFNVELHKLEMLIERALKQKRWYLLLIADEQLWSWQIP